MQFLCFTMTLTTLTIRHTTSEHIQGQTKDAYPPPPIEQINYPDRSGQFDFFFDRVVGIYENRFDNTYNNYTTYAPGIMIDNDRFLTTFNPFREAIRSADHLKYTLVAIMNHRHNLHENQIDYYSIKCARQIVYLPEETIPDILWHSPERKLNPIHDLLIMRTETKLQPETPKEMTRDNMYSLKRGPILSDLAQPKDVFKAPFKFASLGYTDKEHMEQFASLKVTYYSEDDDAIVDCDSWIPRVWGYFICIRNIHKYPGLGSGAVLVHNDTVFGLGCFALFRIEAIYVFTDVRPYSELISKGCQHEETEG